MGRLKEFEVNRALDRAARLFWRKGYENTSLKDILAELEILNGSFYHTFKNKRSLYLKSMRYYNEVIIAERTAPFEEHEDIRLAFRGFFKSVFKTFKNGRNPRGCLMANSITEEVLQHKDLRRYVENQVSAFTGYFEAKIQDAMDRGFKSRMSAEALASLVVIFLQGVLRLSRLNTISTKKLEQRTENFLSSIGL